MDAELEQLKEQIRVMEEEIAELENTPKVAINEGRARDAFTREAIAALAQAILTFDRRASLSTEDHGKIKKLPGGAG